MRYLRTIVVLSIIFLAVWMAWACALLTMTGEGVFSRTNAQSGRDGSYADQKVPQTNRDTATRGDNDKNVQSTTNTVNNAQRSLEKVLVKK